MRQRFSNEEVLNGIQTGRDDKVLEFLYDTVLPKVKQMVYKYRGSEDEAYDTFQEAILRFYHFVKQGKFDASHKAEAFIYTVSKNLYIDYMRRQNKSVKIESFKDEGSTQRDSPLEKMISEEKEAKVKALFSRLGETCNHLLMYCFYHDLPVKEICEKMGFGSEDVLKTKKYKCKQRLLQLIKEDPSLNPKLLIN
jgi:RNA polymerase sigma factor (sigma-70 family)